ncbi:Eukaryotic translation initiation factor 3 subunit C-like isoform X2 [Oopsacas minuta]|uniref:Eukaryotic translation initiation factor 3 subunit C-like isoform X2 n=1 Tax=Oopsacas minuta TaxID=111878 RepID=A0AAV7KA57_9METZ|nr:Eukaryotic translation initiation factor 3 subunit C-like isoform X2 [Oopsacas minuta]
MSEVRFDYNIEMANLIWSNSSDDSDKEIYEKPEKPGIKKSRPMLALDNEETQKVVVRNVKEKRTKELDDTIKLINNSARIRDVSKVCDLFANLIQVFEKGKFNLKTDMSIGKSYFKTLLDIKTFINEQWESRSRLNRTNARALNTLKQRWNKYTKDFQAELEAYKENPNRTPEPDIDELEEAREPTPVDSPVTVQEEPLPPPASDKPDEKDDSEWSDETDSSDVTTSSDTDSDIGSEIRLTARHFLKSYTQAKKASQISRKRTTEAKEKKPKEELDDDKKGPKAGETLEELTIQRVLNEEDKILSLRGRTSERPTQLVDGLIKLQAKSREAKLGDALALRLCFRIISAIFDLKPGPINTTGQSRKWELSLKYVREMLDQLLQHPEIKLYSTYTDSEIETVGEEVLVIGDPLMWVERLNDQLFNLLQNTDHNSILYIDRLRDDVTLFVIFNLLEDFLKSISATPDSFVRLAVMRLEHHYYKPSALLKATYYKDETLNPDEIVLKMGEYVFENDSKEMYVKSVIFLVYYLAINDDWIQVQHIMLTHRVQDIVQQYSKQVQILYNRALAQLGICAFRHGHLDIAHDTLLDLISNSRLKEHLAQGFNPRSLDSEQEPVAMKFILPYHLHISVELIECVYMCAAMIKEVPYMASKELETKKRLISRLFHNQLKNREKQLIVGPPDSSRDYVIAAAYKMREGNWKQCCNLVLNVRVWSLFKQEKQVKEMLEIRIKETTLETYLYGFSQAYSSISLSSLADKFELPESTVCKIVSQLISSHKLQASLDEPSRSIIIHSTQANRLQQLSIRLSEKLDLLTSANQDMAKFKQINIPQEYQRGRH